MDLIDRQVAIEAIARRDTTDGTVKVFGGREVVEILKSLPFAQPDPQWIPCSERLPKSSETVLITHRGGTSFGWYNGMYWERGAGQSHRAIKTVTAWMPLPKPYWGK